MLALPAALFPSQALAVVTAVRALLGPLGCSLMFCDHIARGVAAAYVHGENEIRNIREVRAAMIAYGLDSSPAVTSIAAVRLLVADIAEAIDARGRAAIDAEEVDPAAMGAALAVY